jgi:hypothetical protein
VPPAFVEAAMRGTSKVPARVWRATFESRWRGDGDYSGELDRIRAPTLVVWGGRDARYTRAEQEALVSAIDRARLLVYDRRWPPPPLGGARTRCTRPGRVRRPILRGSNSLAHSDASQERPGVRRAYHRSDGGMNRRLERS